MNGIIHSCTHPKENDPSFRMSEERMALIMFTYIDKLFHAILPKKVFMMAIDGCAPRAKMNQQRQRRFKSALEAKRAKEKALSEGLELPEEPPFDSNVITPGTEFMDRLTNYFHYFIRKKIKEDESWRKIKIIFSGQDVPGEGEHKIMQFIRKLKNSDEYNPNLRHCIYGLDADLIMLGLVTHEPNFCLLREEVLTKLGRNRNKEIFKKEEFHLLSLTLLREYMENEFSNFWKENLIAFQYDFERIIDDFILMAFFVGNDFLPHLQMMDISSGAFEILFENYKKSICHLDDYLTFKGKINWKSLQIFFDLLKPKEEETLKREASKENEGEENEITFENLKTNYYKKFEVVTDENFKNQLVFDYLKGIQWVFHYYVNGCVSW